MRDQFSPEAGKNFQAWPNFELAEVNRKDKFAVFEVLNTDFWRGGGIRLSAKGDDLKSYNQNKAVLFNHGASLGQAQWIRHIPNFASATSIRSKWGPPDIKTTSQNRQMVDFAHEVFEWVDAGQIVGASAGFAPSEVLFGEQAMKAYKEDYPEDKRQSVKDTQVYIRLYDMFEWSIVPTPRIASALRLSCSDYAKTQLDNVLISSYNAPEVLLSFEERLAKIELMIAETSGQKQIPKTGDVSVKINTGELMNIVNQHLKRKS